MLKKNLLVFIFSSFIFLVQGQAPSNGITGTLEALGSSSSDLPFWLIHNQSGKYDKLDQPDFVQSLSGFQNFENIFSSNWRLKMGGHLVSAVGSDYQFQFNEIYGKLYSQKLKMEFGLFTEEIAFGGLSSSNGNIARSLDARPYPKIRLATNGFVPFLFAKEWLKFSAEYDEGLLNDERYVHHTHLHHKSLMMRFHVTPTWSLTTGFDHYVMWGGTSPEIGKLPGDLNAYWKYISGQKGSDSFIETEQINVAGNQYGSISFKAEKDFDGFSAILNISHPFEDYSGIYFENKEDNLYGIFLDFHDKEQFINQFIYEFTTTKKQGLDFMYARDPDSGELIKVKEEDNYFNHYIYRSGATYNNYALASPLFEPIIIEDGISMGFLSPRLLAHHVGIKGYVLGLQWKSLLTYTSYFGTWNSPFEEKKEQFSGLFELSYQQHALPFDISLSLAMDQGDMYEHRFGGVLKLSKQW